MASQLNIVVWVGCQSGIRTYNFPWGYDTRRGVDGETEPRIDGSDLVIGLSQSNGMLSELEQRTLSVFIVKDRRQSLMGVELPCRVGFGEGWQGTVSFVPQPDAMTAARLNARVDRMDAAPTLSAFSNAMPFPSSRPA